MTHSAWLVENRSEGIHVGRSDQSIHQLAAVGFHGPSVSQDFGERVEKLMGPMTWASLSENAMIGYGREAIDIKIRPSSLVRRFAEKHNDQ